MGKRSKRKNRHKRVGLDFDHDVVISGIGQNPDGSLTFFGADGNPLNIQAGFAGAGYERTKGPKTTFQIPDAGQAVASQAAALKRYARIVGADTNSRTHGGETGCVSVFCQLKDLTWEGQKWSAEVEPLWALEFHEPQKASERIGWRHLLAWADKLGWIGVDKSLLIVVDAFLDELHDINQRRTPVIDDFMLPNGVQIAYASADVAGDSPLNGLMTRCDRFANGVLEHVLKPSSQNLPALTTADRTPFRGHRYWKIE